MRISNIETFPVALELMRPFKIANASFNHMYYVMIKIETDDGVTGYGESIPAWEVTGETQFSVMDCLHHLTEENKLGFTLIGQEVSSLQNVKDIMAILCPNNHVNVFWGAPSAKAGLEEALLDIVGKTQGKPIYELFGGQKKSVPFAHVLGIAPVKETLAQAKELLENGIDKIKLKIGVETIDGLENYQRDVDVILGIKNLIEKIRPGAKMVADANQGFITAGKTIAFLKKIPHCLDYLEQPVIAGDRLGMKQIKEHCDVTLMADESLHSYYDAQILLALNAADVFNIKLMKCGGMIEALKLADLARQNNKRAVLGSMMENQVGAIPSLHAFFCDDLFDSTESGFFKHLKTQIGSGLSVDGNFIKVPSGPGIGLDVDERDFQKYLLTTDRSKALKRILNLYSYSC
ncbi:MAG: mandelate racemase/muconate lactonizing enzyme family protein [Nitrospiria bacterium]